MSHWKQIAAARAVLDRETGTVFKEHGGKLKVALAYPNSYSVGMSSLALHILYRALNDQPDVVCERVFWDPDPARSGPLLRTLETQTPVREFDVLAFTISFEMDYFNVAAMLRRAGIFCEPDRFAQGDPDERPLLLAGGPAVTMNPEPMAPFFDAIFIGEVEEALPRLLDVLREGIAGERDRLLDALDALPGMYVPSRVTPAQHGRQIERRWVHAPEALRPVSCLYSPDAEFGDMHLIEIARGCGRGCRFCLAGYVYRPPREQPLERILAWAEEGLARRLPVYAHGGKTGERPPGIGLVSAAVSDHSQIDALAAELRARGARLSVSSMRTDPISVSLVEALRAGGARTLTIAPEAGTERLRRVIHKTQAEDDLLGAVELAQRLDFAQLKMYFMVGHPTETEEDIQGIVDLTLKARALFRRNMTVNATPFVPKAHTPFQWVAMTPARTLQSRQNLLRRNLARHGVEVSADSPEWAEVQGVLARGDRRLAPVIFAVSERPTVRGFHAALAGQGLRAQDFLGERDPASWQPWEVVDTGVKLSYLRHEDRLADLGRPGHRCPPGTTACQACGVCVPDVRTTT